MSELDYPDAPMAAPSPRRRESTSGVGTVAYMVPRLRAHAPSYRRFARGLASFPRRRESISDARTSSSMGPRLRGDDGCDARLAPMRLRGAGRSGEIEPRDLRRRSDQGRKVRESKDLLLAIDQGHAKRARDDFRLPGELLAKSQVHIQPYFRGLRAGPSRIAATTGPISAKPARASGGRTPITKPRIAGMSVTTQRSVTVCLDENLKPLRPAISWLDQRRTSQYPPLPPWLETALRAAGQGRAIHYFQSRAECNWLAAEDPALCGQDAALPVSFGLFQSQADGALARRGGEPGRLRSLRRQAAAMGGTARSQMEALPCEARMLPELVPAGQRSGAWALRQPMRQAFPRGCRSMPLARTRRARFWPRAHGRRNSRS